MKPNAEGKRQPAHKPDPPIHGESKASKPFTTPEPAQAAKAEQHPVDEHAAIRARIVAYCRWGIAHEPQIHYAETRPIPLQHRRQLPLTTDCSGFATCAYLDAGAPDPNGQHFDGQGYTGTMLDHGRPVPLHAAKAGDLVVFGPHPGHHVCVLLEDGSHGDPLLASHGQEAGPVAIKLSVEQAYQPHPATFLSYLP